MRRARAVALLLGFACLGIPGSIPGLQATLGLEYDDNPFEKTAESRRAGWVNRLFLFSSARLLETSRGALQVQHQWGLKRFWKAEESDGALGGVVASQLEIAGLAQVHERVTASWGSELKVKNVQRISSEESYLHGVLRLGLTGRLGRGFSGVLRYRRGGDDARDTTLADLSVNQVGIELEYGRSRQLRGRLGLTWRWLDYDRPVLRAQASDSVATELEDQSDRGRELRASIQFYRGALVHASYSLLDNDSNSVGFGFRSHRVQLLLTRHIFKGVDGQVYLTLQRRRYDEALPASLPTAEVEEDEFEQGLLSFKASRQLTTRYGVSSQYRHARNGSRRGEGSYHKNIYSLALDITF